MSAQLLRAQVRAAGHASKLKKKISESHCRAGRTGKGWASNVSSTKKGTKQSPRRDNAVLGYRQRWSIPRGMFCSFSTPYVFDKAQLLQGRKTERTLQISFSFTERQTRAAGAFTLVHNYFWARHGGPHHESSSQVLTTRARIERDCPLLSCVHILCFSMPCFAVSMHWRPKGNTKYILGSRPTESTELRNETRELATQSILVMLSRGFRLPRWKWEVDELPAYPAEGFINGIDLLREFVTPYSMLRNPFTCR